MAEVVAGLYALETAVEGAALGAFAVSRPTAPLHLSFRKISLPAKSHELARSRHTLNIVKGKGYVIGGQSNGDNNAILALTLPVASSTDGEGDLTPRDYEIIQPRFKDSDRPLAPQKEAESGNDSHAIFDRVGHTTTAIGDKLYIWGGQTITTDSTDENLFNNFVVFDPLTSTYDFLKVDATNCRDGLPSPRRNHAATSSPPQQSDPLPNGSRLVGQGTIFIHGGASSVESHSTLRDSWAFDVERRVWTRLPDAPDPGPSEVANEGKLAYVDGRLWRLGDGFGRAMYLELPKNHSPDAATKWQVISFGTEATDPDGAAPGPDPAPDTKDASSLPMPRISASVLPVTTGSGRVYLLYFMGQELKTGVTNDFWSFQIPSEENTASSLKDTIRDAIASKAKKSWSSGKFSWAKCEIEIEAGSDQEKKDKKEESTVTWPEGEELHALASDIWADQGGNVFVIWGGKRGERADTAVDGGWVVTVK